MSREVLLLQQFDNGEHYYIHKDWIGVMAVILKMKKEVDDNGNPSKELIKAYMKNIEESLKDIIS